MRESISSSGVEKHANRALWVHPAMAVVHPQAGRPPSGRSAAARHSALAVGYHQKEGRDMQPRGQLWFELERVCQDFRDYSGLSEREASDTLVAVLENLLEEQRTAASLRPPDRRQTPHSET